MQVILYSILNFYYFQPIVLRQRSGESSSLLAELIQAAGMQQQQQLESEQAAQTIISTGEETFNDWVGF